MDLTLVTAFLLLAVPAFFTPGPNNLMLMTSSAKFGTWRTVPHALGVVLGFPLMVFGVGLGLGELFTAYPVVRDVLRWVAAAYFLWMAWHLLGFRIGEVGGSERPMSFVEAVMFQWVNPKAWAMATSFVAAFVVVGDGRLASLLLLTMGCLAIGPVSGFLWMAFGQQLQVVLKRTGGERFLGWILALLMIAAIFLFLR